MTGVQVVTELYLAAPNDDIIHTMHHTIYAQTPEDPSFQWLVYMLQMNEKFGIPRLIPDLIPNILNKNLAFTIILPKPVIFVFLLVLYII